MMQDDRGCGRHEFWPVIAGNDGGDVIIRTTLHVLSSDLPLDQFQLELGDRFRWIEALRAGLGAVHDGVAAIEPERVLETVEPLAGGLIAAILDPARRLQQRGRPQETFAVPPIARA